MARRTLKNQPGDYVAVPMAGMPDAIGKVVEATVETITVQVGGQLRTYTAPLHRLRWVRRGGRAVAVRA